MIEGLKLDFTTKELQELLDLKIDYHNERTEFYRSQAKALTDGNAEAMQYTGGDPVKALNDKSASHRSRAELLKVIRTHLVASETYRLSDEDLYKLEIVSRGW